MRSWLSAIAICALFLTSCQKRYGSMSLSEIESTPYVQKCVYYWNAKEMIGLPTLQGQNALDNCSCVFLWAVASHEPTLSAGDYANRNHDIHTEWCLDGKTPDPNSSRLLEGLNARQTALLSRPQATAVKQAIRQRKELVSLKTLELSSLVKFSENALEENHYCAPAGANLIEYQLALRDKGQDSADAMLKTLFPGAVQATEEAIRHHDFREANRLLDLLEKMDSSSPEIARLSLALKNSVNVPAAAGPRVNYCNGEA